MYSTQKGKSLPTTQKDDLISYKFSISKHKDLIGSYTPNCRFITPKNNGYSPFWDGTQ
jgi:hypothetical protein